MKLTVQQSALKKAVQAVMPAVATKTTLPALSCIKLTAEVGRVTLEATDLEKSIRASFEANIDEEGAILLPARLFGELVGATPNEKVTLSLVKDELHYKYNKSVSKMKGLDAEQFPLLATANAERIWDAAQLASAIDIVAFAAATDESRPILTGVLFDYKGGVLTLAAADGFRLSIHSPSVTISHADFRVIIPARSLVELSKLLVAGGMVGATTTERNQVVFSVGDFELVTNTIEGTFPDVKMILPKEESITTRVVVSRATLLSAVRRVQIFAREGANLIKVLVGGGEMTLKGRGAESGESVETIEARADGPQLEVAFNGKYLSEVLAVLPTEQVELSLKSISSPAVLRGVGLPDYTHVLMPMHVSQGQGEKVEA